MVRRSQRSADSARLASVARADEEFAAGGHYTYSTPGPGPGAVTVGSDRHFGPPPLSPRTLRKLGRPAVPLPTGASTPAARARGGGARGQTASGVGGAAAGGLHGSFGA